MFGKFISFKFHKQLPRRLIRVTQGFEAAAVAVGHGCFGTPCCAQVGIRGACLQPCMGRGRRVDQDDGFAWAASTICKWEILVLYVECSWSVRWHEAFAG